jgi:hypothetical protein
MQMIIRLKTAYIKLIFAVISGNLQNVIIVLLIKRFMRGDNG